MRFREVELEEISRRADTHRFAPFITRNLLIFGRNNFQKAFLRVKKGMEAYQIHNVIKNWSYVGITINDFNSRYKNHPWWEYDRLNSILKADLLIYKPEDFIIIKLAENVETIEELNSLEKQYIIELNCRWPNGYNLKEGGRNGKWNDSTRRKVSLIRRKIDEFKFRSPQGEIIEVDILEGFCKEKGLSSGGMSDLVNGNIDFYNGYTRVDFKIEERSFVSPNGKIFKIKMIPGHFLDFCKKFNLIHTGISELWSGNTHIFNGWTRLDKAFVKKTLVSPSGETFEIFTWELFNFCVKNKLSMGRMIEIWFDNTSYRGRIYKGWYLEENKEFLLDNKRSIECRKQTSLNSRKATNYKFRSPDGKIYEPEVLRYFCEEHGLNECAMSMMTDQIDETRKSRIFSHRGWTNANHVIEIRSFISPEGQIVHIENTYGNLQKFYDKFNLNRTAMIGLWKGRSKSCQGWRVYQEN